MIDGTREGVKTKTGGVTLVEESTTEEFDITKLTSRKLIGHNRPLAVGDDRTQTAWDIDEDTVDGFLFLLGVGRSSLRNGLQIFDMYIIRYAREIVAVNQS